MNGTRKRDSNSYRYLEESVVSAMREILRNSKSTILSPTDKEAVLIVQGTLVRKGKRYAVNVTINIQKAGEAVVDIRKVKREIRKHVIPYIC